MSVYDIISLYAKNNYSIQSWFAGSCSSNLWSFSILAYIKKGIPSIYIEDAISKDIIIIDVVLEETRVQASNCIKKTINSVCTRLVNRDAINLREIKSSISEIVSQLLENKRMIYDIIDIRSVDDYLFGHSVNVCVL